MGRSVRPLGRGLALALAVATLAPRSVADVSSPKGHEAQALARRAVEAHARADHAACIKLDTQSLELEESGRTYLHRATCRARVGSIALAHRDAQRALALAIEHKDLDLADAARARLDELEPRVARVTFGEAQRDVADLVVAFDGQPVKDLARVYATDPGEHVVELRGVLGGEVVTSRTTLRLGDGERRAIPITLERPTPRHLTREQLRCLENAQTDEDVATCIGKTAGSPPLIVRAAAELSGYTDSLAVNVVSPKIDASVTSPTSGWSVGAGYLLDVLSAASPDIVSMASRKYTESRHAGHVTGGYKPGLFGARASANVSSEPDYLSLGGGLALTADLADKTVTPRLGYQIGRDTIGKGQTSFDAFHHTLFSHTFEGSVAVVLSRRQVLVAGATLQIESGDQSKPYRYVPMFPASVAAGATAGAPIDQVDAARLSARPTEQLPLERTRLAASARYLHRMGPWGTARLEERLYGDTWGTKASTTDARVLFEASERLRLGPHLRLHAQTGASFHRLAYSATVTPSGDVVLPAFRTGDRELAPLVTVTAGGSARVELTPARAKTAVAMLVQADAMWTRFFDSLFVTQRRAVYGTVGAEVLFE